MSEASKFRLSNPYLTDEDHLYHIALTTSDNLAQRFGDVKFVCMGGKGKRMRNFAELLYDQLGKPENSELETELQSNGFRLKDISASGGRYSLFKVGPVISASHGIGMASLSVVLHEILKLTHYAGCSDVIFLRLGTSGGLGLDPGTVVITEKSYNGLLENCYNQIACGKLIRYDANTDPKIADRLLNCAQKANVKAMKGNTIGSNDFFEEQARLDGALCSYTAQEKDEFLKRAHDVYGVKNMEMESPCFSALCHRANVKCGIVCVALVNRLEHDDVTTDVEQLVQWELEPQRLLVEFIKESC